MPSELCTGRFWRQWFGGVFAAIGFFSVVAGLVLALFPNVLTRDRGAATVGIVVISVTYGSFRSWPRPIQWSYNSPNMKIRLVSGDLFAQDGHLVIGMCDTFDTSTPVIIDKRSVQGQFLERIFEGDVMELDRQILSALSGIDPVDSIDKDGKQAKYPVGTVATLPDGDRRYFCVAYTEMDARNMARGSVGGIQRSLESLWDAVSAHGNGGVVAIPVIGGGQARIAQILPAQDSIRLMILSFVLASRREKVCDGLDIVVRPTEYEKLDRLEIQAFLESLSPS